MEYADPHVPNCQIIPNGAGRDGHIILYNTGSDTYALGSTFPELEALFLRDRHGMPLCAVWEPDTGHGEGYWSVWVYDAYGEHTDLERRVLVRNIDTRP
jgi:hypothetical protein